ncbi:MAG: BrnT family toxin [Propionibacteriaceae bacterium]|jgi:uncharacterized DUF497 family protein|nr:BrnT family toxin [Propionibacteriaceae bacterium]
MIGSWFEWDDAKERINTEKHDVSFQGAATAFLDVHRVIARDQTHSTDEQRWFCYGQTDRGILTVRFTYRGDRIRIIGAGYWRQGKRKYESQQ